MLQELCYDNGNEKKDTRAKEYNHHEEDTFYQFVLCNNIDVFLHSLRGSA